MPRTITDTVKTALAADHVVHMFFVEMDLESGYFRTCTAAYSFTWDSKTWLGIAYIGKFDAIREAATLEAKGISFEMSGIPAEQIAYVLGEHYQGRKCTVWKAVLNPDTFAILADPFIIYKGRLDTLDVVELGKKAVIQVQILDRRADWDKPRIRRFTDADQKLDYPDDKGFEFAEAMADKELIWGDFST